MPLHTTAGSVIEIGQPLAQKTTDFVEGDFSAQSWVPVQWAENLGQLGDEATLVTFEAIANERVHKFKGTRDAGSMDLVFGIDYSDIGQATVRGAETEDLDYAFRVTFDDQPSGGSTPSYRYFIAKVLSAREQFDGANNVQRLNVSLSVTSNIVRVSAT